MLTCRELTELVTEYIDGRMPVGERLSFRLHLLTCPKCQVYVNQMKQTVSALGAIPSVEVSQDTLEALKQTFGNWKRGDRSD